MKHIRLAIPPVGFELKVFDMDGYTVENNIKAWGGGSIAHATGSYTDMPALTGVMPDQAVGAQR